MVKKNKLASLERRKKINEDAAKHTREAKRQDSRAVHDTKGKNLYGRAF